MAWEIPGFSFTRPAAGDLSAAQYTFVTVPDSAGRVTTAGAGVNSLGIQQNAPAAIDRGVTIVADGISKMKAGAAITIGAKLMSDDSGRGIAATSGNSVLAIALSAATAANQIIPVLLVKTPVLA